MSLANLANVVRDIPLTDVLERHGFEVRREGSTYRAKSEGHNIVITGTQWFDNKAGLGGGGAIDLEIHLTKASFRDACRALADRVPGKNISPRSTRNITRPLRKSFDELASIHAVRDDTNWPIARAYLVEKRFISQGLVDALYAEGSIYSNDHRPNPSLVFLHRSADGTVCGATLRDTRHRSAFRPCLGNKNSAWFAVGDLATAERVVAVESPIDALSYFDLRGGSGGELAVVSCSGATVPLDLMAGAFDRRQSFVVALDNDSAGERGWQKAWDETTDWEGFRISSESPSRKDWNDDLVFEKSRRIRAGLKL